MILVAIGSNLTAPGLGTSLEVCERAMARLESLGITIVAISRFYETAPVPLSDQPWFVNGMISVETTLMPAPLMALLHQVEQEFGRMRRRLNEARVLDLDLIDYNGVITDEGPTLPHPRLASRSFVLYPLYDLAPDWMHPVNMVPVRDLIAALPGDQAIRVLSPATKGQGPELRA